MIRIAAVGAVAALSLVALVACGEPSGQVSPSGTNWTVAFTKDFQNSTGKPIVSAKAVCRNESFWRESVRVNVNSYGPTVTLSVYCPSGVLNGSWGEYRS